MFRVTLEGPVPATHTFALQCGPDAGGENLCFSVDPKVVQERLGHSSVTMTLDLYSHAVPAMQANAASIVAALHDVAAGVRPSVSIATARRDERPPMGPLSCSKCGVPERTRTSDL